MPRAGRSRCRCPPPSPGAAAAEPALGRAAAGTWKAPSRRATPPWRREPRSLPRSFGDQASQELRIDGVARRLHAIDEPRPQPRRGEPALDAAVAIHAFAAEDDQLLQ